MCTKIDIASEIVSATVCKQSRNDAPLSLLIVDDVPLNLKLLRAMLETEGCTVVVACNGVEALAALEREPFDGVVSDIQMPQMDGFQLCRAIRGNESLRNLPFVFYTATYTAAMDRELGERLGADAYLIKPAPVESILAALRREAVRGESDFAEGDVVSLYGAALSRKIDEKKQLVDRQSMQYAISRMLGEAQSLEAVVPEILRVMCQTLGWVGGAYWSWNGSGRTFECLHTWTAFAPESGDEAIQPPRPPPQSAALLPIDIESRPIGILQFFSTHPRGPSADVLQCAEAVALNIGQFAARIAAQGEIRRLAHFDSLTDLPNRNLFRELAARALARAQRSRKPLALLFVDLDGFKQVNDGHGHDVGDCVLATFAARLRECLRGSDTVIRNVESSAAARLGGDEFAILIDDFEQWSALEAIAQKILVAAAAPFIATDCECNIGASIGIAVYPDHGQDLDALKCAADCAMYRAKQAGKNTFRFAETAGEEKMAVALAELRCMPLGEGKDSGTADP